MQLEDFLADLPLLHTWDEGKTWNTGGFHKESFEQLDDFFDNLPENPRIIETGAGNSTLFFLIKNPGRLVTIAPDAELHQRISSFCDQNRIDRSSYEPHIEASQWALPQLAADGDKFDFALIDGSHNWPLVFVDFYYINALLKADSFLMIDDVQLHSVKELSRLLMEQPGFELVCHFQKSAIFKKLWDADLPDFGGQPYILRKSAEYEASGNPFSLT